MIQIVYMVIEHYADDACEPFGTYLHDGDPPRQGDMIQLKWLDGRDAHRVMVDRVTGFTIHAFHPGHEHSADAQGTKKTEEQ